MPTLIQSTIAKGNVAAPYPQYNGEVVAIRASVTVPAGAVQNDIFELLSIPPGCRPVDAILDSDDCDSGTAIKFDVGLMSGNFGDNDATRTVGNELFAASTVGQAGGSARPTDKGAFRIAASDTERGVGLKINTAAGTGVAGSVGLTLFYVAN